MIDIKLIRENPELIKQTIKNKNQQGRVDVDQIIELDNEIQSLQTELEKIRQERNSINNQIKKAQDKGERDKLIEKNTALKPRVQEIEEEMKEYQEKFDELILLVPNVTSPKMPVGLDEHSNQVIRSWGEIPKFDFEVRDHVDLGELLDIIDVKKSGEITGSRFYYLKNEAVLMQFGIVQLVFETLTSRQTIKEIADRVGNPYDKPFVPMVPPVMIRPEIMKKMDRLDPIDERYELPKDDLILVGSAEHTLGPYHMNEVIPVSELPIRYIGYSTAFRREAGSYGKDVRGILRAHQFDKLEMETYVPEEAGEVEQELIVALQEHLVQLLGIPYQVIQVCTGDTGKPDYNQYDIECWMPGQGRYRETHTSDYMTDYQSRRLNIRYATEKGEKKFVHMNDATAFAIGRILIAIIENNQQKDGSVVVPEVLRKYVGTELIVPRKK